MHTVSHRLHDVESEGCQSFVGEMSGHRSEATHSSNSMKPLLRLSSTIIAAFVSASSSSNIESWQRRLNSLNSSLMSEFVSYLEKVLASSAASSSERLNFSVASNPYLSAHSPSNSQFRFTMVKRSNITSRCQALSA